MAKCAKRIGSLVALYVLLDGSVAIGPAHALLLQEVRDAASMAASQRRLGAGHSHMGKLVAAMSAASALPLVELMRGGGLRQPLARRNRGLVRSCPFLLTEPRLALANSLIVGQYRYIRRYITMREGPQQTQPRPEP